MAFLAVFPSPPPPPPCCRRRTVTVLLGISRPAAFPGRQFEAFTSPQGAEARHRLAVCGRNISACPPPLPLPPPHPPATSFCRSRPPQPLATVSRSGLVLVRTEKGVILLTDLGPTADLHSLLSVSVSMQTHGKVQLSRPLSPTPLFPTPLPPPLTPSSSPRKLGFMSHLINNGIDS